MAKDNDDRSGNDNARPHGVSPKPPGKLRQEPTFSQYDEDDEYEESDRDADYTSGYHVDDDIPDEDFDDDYREDDEEDEPDLFRDEEADSEYDYDAPDEDEDEALAEDERYFEEDQGRQQSWPLGLIAVAIIALILLVAGGYGVMQQRAETENELRELRAALATTANPKAVTASRDALEERQQAFETLATEAEALRLENRALSDTIAGLQAQMGELRVALTPESNAESAERSVQATEVSPAATVVSQPKPVAQAAPAPKPEPKPVPPPTPKPESQRAAPVISDATGPWFVNFGSYAMRNMAQSWASRLQPGAGKVVVIPISSDGRTLYRLRVVGLANRETAQQVARKLETDLQVSKLWVGEE